MKKFRDIIDSKVAALVLIASLSLACASTGGAKKGATVGLSAARAALDLVEVTLLKTECGKPGAPLAPACVPKDSADKAFRIVAKAAGVGEKAAAAIRALPPGLDGSTTTPEIQGFIGEIWTLIWEVKGLFPASPPAEELSTKLDKLSKS